MFDEKKKKKRLGALIKELGKVEDAEERAKLIAEINGLLPDDLKLGVTDDEEDAEEAAEEAAESEEPAETESEPAGEAEAEEPSEAAEPADADAPQIETEEATEEEAEDASPVETVEMTEEEAEEAQKDIAEANTNEVEEPIVDRDEDRWQALSARISTIEEIVNDLLQKQAENAEAVRKDNAQDFGGIPPAQPSGEDERDNYWTRVYAGGNYKKYI